MFRDATQKRLFDHWMHQSEPPRDGHSAVFHADHGPALAGPMQRLEADFGSQGLIVTAQEGVGIEPELLYSSVATAADVGTGRMEELDDHSRWSRLSYAGQSWIMMSTAGADEAGIVFELSMLFLAPGPPDRRDIDAMLAERMAFIMPLLSLFQAERRLRWRQQGLVCALDRCDIGILLLDRYGRLAFANRAGKALLAAGNGIRYNGGSIGASELADALKLQVAIDHVSGLPGFGNARRTPVVALRRRHNRRPLMVSVTAPDEEGSSDLGTVLYVIDPDHDITSLMGPACKLYGLSPVEARLTSLIVGGSSVAEAAEAMRIKDQTARTYLKQVFSKTDTSRQADLVRVMLASLVPVAAANVEMV